MTIWDFIISVGFSGFLTAVFIFLSREWISARLKTSIQHEYDQKLEAHKAKLKAEGDISVIELGARLEREASLHAFAHASFAEGQKAAIERKLDAIDKLWDRMLKIRSRIPSALRIVDYLNDDERIKKFKDTDIQNKAKEFSKPKLDAMIDDEKINIEQVRPYIGEYIWSIILSYEVIILRFLLLWRQELDAGAKNNWDDNSDMRQLLCESLTKDELIEFDKLLGGRVGWLQQHLELKILNAFKKVISGEEFAMGALEQAKRIQQLAMKLRTEDPLD